MRVLVTGGRRYSNKARLFAELDAIDAEHCIDCIIQGECPTGGADALAKHWAHVRGVPCDGYRPEGSWPMAGPIRNQRMADEGRADLVVEFPGGSGTADMVRKARAKGIPVQRVE